MIRPMLDPICDLAGADHLPVEDLDGIEAYMRQLEQILFNPGHILQL